VVASRCRLRLSSGVCGPKKTLKVSVQNVFQCISLPLSRWWDKVMRSVQWSDWRLSSNNVFFLPSLFPFSPPRNNMLVIAKKKKKSKEVWLFFCLFKLDPHFFSLRCIGLKSFIELIFFLISSIHIWFLYQIWSLLF